MLPIHISLADLVGASEDDTMDTHSYLGIDYAAWVSGFGARDNAEIEAQYDIGMLGDIMMFKMCIRGKWMHA